MVRTKPYLLKHCSVLNKTLNTFKTYKYTHFSYTYIYLYILYITYNNNNLTYNYDHIFHKSS